MTETGRILPLKILVREVKPPEKVGSIILAPLARQTTITGEVVLIGDIPQTGQFKDFKLGKGDKILHGPNSFVEVEIEGEKLRLLNIQDVLFIWR